MTPRSRGRGQGDTFSSISSIEEVRGQSPGLLLFEGAYRYGRHFLLCIFLLRGILSKGISFFNKISQASSGTCHRGSNRGVTFFNGPAMPLNDAHFGGFFVLERGQ